MRLLRFPVSVAALLGHFAVQGLGLGLMVARLHAGCSVITSSGAVWDGFGILA